MMSTYRKGVRIGTNENADLHDSVQTLACKAERIGENRFFRIYSHICFQIGTNSENPNSSESARIWEMGNDLAESAFSICADFGRQCVGRFEQIGPRRSPRFERDVRSDPNALYCRPSIYITENPALGVIEEKDYVDYVRTCSHMPYGSYRDICPSRGPKPCEGNTYHYHRLRGALSAAAFVASNLVSKG